MNTDSGSAKVKSTQEEDLLCKYSLMIVSLETGLGSLLHAFHIPLRGNFLSLHQSFWLCRAHIEGTALLSRKFLPAKISILAALLKSLSPLQSGLGPLMSLSAQGSLFSLGLILGGNGIIGHCLATLLLGMWSFIQPFLTYFLFFGTNLPRAILYFWTKALPAAWHPRATIAISILLLTKALLCLGVVFLARYGSVERITKWSQILVENNRPRKANPTPLIRGILKDLSHPFFLLSLTLTAAFLWQSESSVSLVAKVILRSTAIATLFFFVARKGYLTKFALRRSLHTNSKFLLSLSRLVKHPNA